MGLMHVRTNSKAANAHVVGTHCREARERLAEGYRTYCHEQDEGGRAEDAPATRANKTATRIGRVEVRHVVTAFGEFLS